MAHSSEFLAHAPTPTATTMPLRSVHSACFQPILRRAVRDDLGRADEGETASTGSRCAVERSKFWPRRGALGDSDRLVFPFRGWAAERMDHRREAIEAVLAHVVQNRVEAAPRPVSP